MDLNTAKTEAKAALKALVDGSGLTGEDLAAVQKIADEYSAKIDAATTAEAVAAERSAGTSALLAKISELKLPAAKKAAKAELEALVDQSGLTGSSLEAVKKLAAEHEAKIDAAGSTADLAKVLSDAKTALAKAIDDAKAQDKDKTQLSGALVKLSKSKFAYTGKKIKPEVTVVCMGKTLVKGKDYTLSFAANKAVGKATVTVTGAGSYAGTVSKSFTINPKATKIKKLAAYKKTVKATWAKRAAQASGYQLCYSSSKSMKSAKTVTVKNAKVTSKTIKKLASGKRCYIKVRVFKTQGNAKFYSAWSKVKSVVVK